MDAEQRFADGALLIIDAINDFAFPGGDDLASRMRPVISAIRSLRERADALQRPVIYVNDNFGRWRSNFQQVIEWCRREGGRGADMAERLAPRHTDYFVLKPGQSGFHQTPLPTLLDHLKISTLVLAGVTADQCVLRTALDAHTRNYRLWVPEDTTASLTPARNRRALEYICEVLGGSTAPCME